MLLRSDADRLALVFSGYCLKNSRDSRTELLQTRLLSDRWLDRAPCKMMQYWTLFLMISHSHRMLAKLESYQLFKIPIIVVKQCKSRPSSMQDINAIDPAAKS